MSENNIELEEKKGLNFGDEITKFIQHLEAQTEIVPFVMELVAAKLIQESKDVDKYIKENNLEEENNDDKKEKNNSIKLLIPSDKFKEFIDLDKKVETTLLAYNLLPINFIVSFVSQYDAFLGNLIKTIFYHKPELLNNSDKNLSFSEIISYDSIEDIKDYIIEKEVESVIRENHLKQFKWLESKLKIPLRKDLPSFKHFIEITERRNLFVHNNGVVSRQYIENCTKNEVPNIDKVKVGDKLSVNPGYFVKCYSILFEIGVKLGQVIWRKLLPDELEEADNHLNNICFDLLIKGHYHLASNLLSFATETLKKHYDQEIINIFIINKSLSYYLSGKKEKAKSVLSKQDWSATNDKFKLAIAVLNEDFNEAIDLMKSIGSSNKHINKDAYREWPLFKEFRKRDDFKKAYKEIFNEEFIYIEKKPKNIEDILHYIKHIKKETEKEEKAANKGYT